MAKKAESSGASSSATASEHTPRRGGAKAPPQSIQSSEATGIAKATKNAPRRRPKADKPSVVEQSGAGVDMNTSAFAPLGMPEVYVPSADPLLAINLHLSRIARARIFCQTSQMRIDGSMRSQIAGALGAVSPVTSRAERINAEGIEAIRESSAERKVLYKKATKIMEQVEAGEVPDLPPEDDPRSYSLATWIPLIPISALSRKQWDESRLKAEKEMREVARTLPIFGWVKEHARGVGDLGLARIIGQAPMIGAYQTHERLWKRMGVAVIGGIRQQKRTDKLEAMIHGYAPSRRAELWSVCSDTMFRQQWRKTNNDPEEDDAGRGMPIGPYGAVYWARKQVVSCRIIETEELSFKDPMKWTPKRVDADARRVMSKEFLRDLWRVWHGKEARHPKRWYTQPTPLAA